MGPGDETVQSLSARDRTAHRVHALRLQREGERANVAGFTAWHALLRAVVGEDWTGDTKEETVLNQGFAGKAPVVQTVAVQLT